jgi:glycerol-3-phosphate dehydrogenase (NAD(P)+)
MAVPSHGFRAVLTAAAGSLPPGVPVVSLTKGVEQGSLSRMTEVIAQVLPRHPYCVLTGPNLVGEIVAGHPTASVIATTDAGVAEELQGLFGTASFRVYTNPDVVGCELGGALKNVVAIACGIAQGLAVGDNTRAMVMTRGLGELTRLGVAMGGEPATFAGLAGLGDLQATCMSPQSRNRYVGEQLGLGRKLDEILAEMKMVAEGVNTARTACELADRYGVQLPVCMTIDRVVKGEISASDAYRGLMRRRAGHELDPEGEEHI